MGQSTFITLSVLNTKTVFGYDLILLENSVMSKLTDKFMLKIHGHNNRWYCNRIYDVIHLKHERQLIRCC